MTDSSPLWSISDGRDGNARQADALASALDPAASRLAIDTALPWRWLAPRWLPTRADAFGKAFGSRVGAATALPTLAIGCGRQAALATRWLRRQGSAAVQILDPRIDPVHWNVVVAPEHDGLRAANVITTLGSLHPVDDAWLAQARAAFAAFAELPRPRTAVLLGGSSAHARFEIMAFEVLASKLEVPLARDGGSLLLTTSRRTTRDVRRVLQHRYADTPGVVWRSDADGPNPYAGLLAWADRIVCSPDSVNMISEACATRVPVFVFDPGRVRGRPRAFVDALLARGRIRAMDTTLGEFDVEPLRETARVAAAIRERLA